MTSTDVSSSSCGVTPGRAPAASMCRQRVRIVPAADILSSCSGVLGTIIRYTLAASRGLYGLVGFEPQRGQRPLDLGGDLIGAGGTVDAPQQALPVVVADK